MSRLRWLGVVFLAVAALAPGCSGQTIAAFPDEYVGVGLELTTEAAGARVVKVLPGGAADRAGLAPDDVLLAIGGDETRGKALAEIVDALRGAPGTSVEVLVRTARGERTLTLTRAAIAKRGEDYAAAR